MEGLAERTSAAQTRKGAVIGVLFIVLGLLVAVSGNARYAIDVRPSQPAWWRDD
jgi:hypothetical protein